MEFSISYQEIANSLHGNLIGCNGIVYSYSSLSEIKPNSVVFVKKFNEEIISILNTPELNILAIVTQEFHHKLTCSYILSKNPRLDYIKVISTFFLQKKLYVIHPTAIIEKGAIIGTNVNIGANSYIGKDVSIRENTYIYPNVVITGISTIGNNCIIKSGAVIGQSGFGFEKDENGIPVHFPHLGKIQIGDNVYIGANTAIDRGTLGNTIIGNNVKIDNLVHIAHNDIIGDNSFIIAGTSLGGGVHIGQNCWVAPNVSIKQQLTIGDNVLIGLGAVVLKDVPENSVVVGNPAKEFIKSK